MDERESAKDRMSFRLSGAEAVALAGAAAQTFAQEQWLADDESARLSIIAEELVANLYDHAGVTASDEVHLSFKSDPDGIHVVITDRSAPFDPRTATRKEQVERGGGAGIEIVRAWAEIVDYQSSPDGNRLEVVMPVVHQG